MMRGLALLVLLRTLYPIEAAEVPEQVSLTVAELGGNVTFQCPFSETENHYINWYKQPRGCTIQTVATITFTNQKFSPQFNNSRFRVTAGETQHSLTIMNISKEDEATYFCFSGSLYAPRFVDGTFLAVKDGALQKSFHCAVASCGEILFGGGTRTISNLKAVVIVLGVLLACCVTVIIFLIFYMNQRRVKEATSVACNPAQTQWTADQSANQDGDGEVSNYAAVNLSTRQVNRVKKREPSQDCVYSAVRVNHNTQLHL